MRKYLFKTAVFMTAAIILFSNIAAFADGYKWKYNKVSAFKESKEYTRAGEISEIKSNIITLGEKSDKSMFKLSDKTTIFNADGVKIKSSDLKTGMNVEITYNKISRDKKDKVNNAVSVKILKNSAQIKNVYIEKISDYSKSEKLVKIIYETVDSKNRIIENTMNLIIDANTKIYNQSGDNIKISNLNQGMIIDVEHSSKISRTYIPQAYAYRIDLIRNNENIKITESKIIEKYVSGNKSYILVGDSNAASKQILFILDDNVKIRNKYGKAISFKDLIAGQKIKVEHSSVMTKSLPPQCAAYSIEVIDDLAIDFIEYAIIEEISIKDNSITVSYEVKTGTKYYEYRLILSVDSNTIILDKKGKSVLLNRLKEGMLIDVEHEILATLSSPPKSYAHKINIVRDKYDEAIDDGDCELFKLLIKLYFETDSKEWLNCIMNHNHDWRQLNGKELDDFFENIFENSIYDDDDIENLLDKLFKGYRWDY